MKNTLAATLVAASALIVTAVQAATPEVEALLQAAQKEGAGGHAQHLGKLGENLE